MGLGEREGERERERVRERETQVELTEAGAGAALQGTPKGRSASGMRFCSHARTRGQAANSHSYSPAKKNKPKNHEKDKPSQPTTP